MFWVMPLASARDPRNAGAGHRHLGQTGADWVLAGDKSRRPAVQLCWP